MRQWNAIKTLANSTKTSLMRWLMLEARWRRRLPRGRSEIAANLNVLQRFAFFCEIRKTLAERWLKRHGDGTFNDCVLRCRVRY